MRITEYEYTEYDEINRDDAAFDSWLERQRAKAEAERERRDVDEG